MTDERPDGGQDGSGGNGLSRRGFLQRVGLVGAAATVPGLLAACGGDDTGADGDGGTAGTSPADGGTGTAGATGEALTVGIAVPLSGTYASLGEDMIAGFRLYLEENDGQLGGRPVEIVEAETEANPETGLRVSRRLVEEDQVDMVTGFVSSAVALGVRDFFHESQVPLIVSNAGNNALSRDALSPYIFRTSFTNWQPCFSVGEWAVDEFGGAPFYIIAPDYAAGHQDAEAFREAYEQNGGGTIVDSAFPPFGTTQDYQPFISEIGSSDAEAVFCFFSGGEAINFVQQYESFGLKGELPLIGPGFLTDEGVLEAMGPAATGVRTSLHWTPRLDNEQNTSFLDAYEQSSDTGRAASVFSMQSYDAAALIDATLEQTGGETSDADAVVEAMEGAGTISTSPRGEWTMDPDTHNPTQHFYLREVQEVDGALANTVVTDLGEYTDPGA